MRVKIFDFYGAEVGEEDINAWLKETPNIEIRFIDTIHRDNNNSTRTMIFYSTRKDKLERLNQISDEM